MLGVTQYGVTVTVWSTIYWSNVTLLYQSVPSSLQHCHCSAQLEYHHRAVSLLVTFEANGSLDDDGLQMSLDPWLFVSYLYECSDNIVNQL